jgi:hypothetical protein
MAAETRRRPRHQRTNMTQKEILRRLLMFNLTQTDVTRNLYLAMQAFDDGLELHSWTLLIMWCIAKDEREEAWACLRNDYIDAIEIKEGRAT